MFRQTRLIIAAIAVLVVLALVIAITRPSSPDQPAPPAAAQNSPARVGQAASGQFNTDTPAPSATPTITPLPTGTPAPTSTASPTAPDVPFGAIVDPDYTLAPTDTRPPPTPLPTTVPTAGPSPTPGPGLVSDLMGVQIHPYVDNNEFSAALEHTRTLGLTWVKFQFNWALLESAPGSYTEQFYMLRQYVQRAHRDGFKVLVSVAKAPGWARQGVPGGVLREDAPPADPQTLASFLSGMLNAIGTDVYGQPYISAVEVWNEPNLQREWYGHPLTGGDYMRYFAPAYDAIRAFSPAITVITAAPAPTGDSDVSTNDRNWLQQLYNAGLARYGADVAVGIHPYGWANPPQATCCAQSRGWDNQPQFFFRDTIEEYRQIMVRNGHSNARLWGTEFGWATFDGLTNSLGQRPTDPPDQPFYGFIDQWQQAEYTLRAFQMAQERDYLGPMILWNLNFAMIPGYTDRSHPQTGYGLLDNRGQPRPAYHTLANAPKR